MRNKRIKKEYNEADYSQRIEIKECNKAKLLLKKQKEKQNSKTRDSFDT